MRVLHVITGLGTGGAENMLYKLLGASERSEMAAAVVSLRDRGTVGARIERLGIPVHTLDITPGRPSPAGLLKLSRIWRAFRPDVVQGWMYHANMAASLAGLVVARQTPVLWNVRQTVYHLGMERPGTRIVIRAGARLSMYAKAIIYNSETAARQHEGMGYCRTRTRIIPNGFDCLKFRPDARTRERVRARLQLNDGMIAIGLLARYHPAKGHEDFLRAAGRLARTEKNVRFVLAGSSVDGGNSVLRQLLTDHGLEGRALLLGERDSRRLLPAFDIVALSSVTESFSNSIGEAMACGVPVAVTEVGDAQRIVGGGGLVVPARDPEAMANALKSLVDAGWVGRERIGQIGRERVQRLFSIEAVAESYRQLYAGVLAGRTDGVNKCAG